MPKKITWKRMTSSVRLENGVRQSNCTKEKDSTVGLKGYIGKCRRISTVMLRRRWRNRQKLIWRVCIIQARGLMLGGTSDGRSRETGWNFRTDEKQQKESLIKVKLRTKAENPPATFSAGTAVHSGLSMFAFAEVLMEQPVDWPFDQYMWLFYKKIPMRKLTREEVLNAGISSLPGKPVVCAVREVAGAAAFAEAISMADLAAGRGYLMQWAYTNDDISCLVPGSCQWSADKNSRSWVLSIREIIEAFWLNSMDDSSVSKTYFSARRSCKLKCSEKEEEAHWEARDWWRRMYPAQNWRRKCWWSLGRRGICKYGQNDRVCLSMMVGFGTATDNWKRRLEKI